MERRTLPQQAGGKASGLTPEATSPGVEISRWCFCTEAPINTLLPCKAFPRDS